MIAVLLRAFVILSPRSGDEESAKRFAPRDRFWALPAVIGQDAKEAKGLDGRASAGSARPVTRFHRQQSETPDLETRTTLADSSRP